MTEKKHKTKKELYLKVPYHILNIRGLSPAQKFLLAHIYSFGSKGCWQSNETIAQMFMVSKRTIQTWLASIRNYIFIRNSKGYYRTMWAKSHPDFSPAKCMTYSSAKNDAEVRKNTYPECAKKEIPPRKKLRTTNNNTIKENNNRTTATPAPPLPKGAPALLAERQKQIKVDLELFKQKFGKGKKKWQPLSQEEFERRRAAQLKALLG